MKYLLIGLSFLSSSVFAFDYTAVVWFEKGNAFLNYSVPMATESACEAYVQKLVSHKQRLDYVQCVSSSSGELVVFESHCDFRECQVFKQ